MSYVEYRLDDTVACVTLNRPDKLNALAGTMREDLLAAFADAEADPEVRAVLLTGAGRGFCAGGDVRYMQQLRERNDIADFSRILDAANAVVRALSRSRKPVIAAVNGVAAGGGANMALACDLRVGSTTCAFTQSFVKIGLGPDWGGSVVLPSIVGVDRARELLLTGRTVRSDEALRLGLVHELHVPENLGARARELAASLAAWSPDAVAAIKEGIQQRFDGAIDAALEFERSAQIRCFLTPEAGEAFAAFGRRKP